MKNLSKYVFVVAVFLLVGVQIGDAQNGIQAGIFSPSGNVLSVRAKPVNAISSKLFSDVAVTVKWSASYGITLGTPSGSYGIAAQGSVSTDGTFDYQRFGSTPNALITWAAGSENELFTVTVNGAAGTGSFSLTGSAPGVPWYFELGGSDSTDYGTPFYAASVAGVSLPIQLASFNAATLSKTSAKLNWETLSEINNYGFEVQKSAGSSGTFASITGAFIAGNGTTTVKHDYSYVDNAYASGDVYRLKQLDLTGAAHYTDAVDPLGVTSVAPTPLPKEFSLSQNYPNPFNPSTVIEFALPKDAHVKLDVYNMIGQRVMTLVDALTPAGYHSVKLDGTNLASGMYLYRLTTGQQTFMKKLLLIK